MSPFNPSHSQSQPAAETRSAMRPAWIVFLVCVLLGLGAVGWRAKIRADEQKENARREARTCGATLETQFSQAMSAIEVLGVLARQGNPGSEFQKVASELLAARPGLASLELQPGGTVADIVPRPGNERVIGISILKDPGAVAAKQNRVLTISGPLRLYSGEPGFVLRLPIFQRGRDAFWGFVTCSARLPQLISRSRLDELSRKGYDCALLVNGSPGQKQQTAYLQGQVYLDEAVQFPVQVQNLKFLIALQAKRGWYDTAAVLYEAAGVIILSGILCLLVNMVESRREIETALAEVNRKLVREMTDRKQAQDECLAARDEAGAALIELKRTRSALEQAQPTIVELQSQLAAAKSTQAEMLDSIETQLRTAESKCSELQGQFQAELEAAEQSAHAREGELDRAQANLNQAQQSIAELSAKLAAAAHAEKQAAAAQKQREQDQVTIADLQARLEATSKGTDSVVELTERKLKEAEKANRELHERLTVAEQAAAEVQELTELLKEARAELKLAQERGMQVESVQQAADQPPAEVAGEPPPADPPSPGVNKSVLVAEDQGAEVTPSAVAADESTPVAVEPTVEKKSSKPSRRKKRSDAQMDLFGEPSPEASPAEGVSAVSKEAVLENDSVQSDEIAVQPGIRIGSDPDAIFESVLEEEESESTKHSQAKEEKPSRRYAASGPVDEAELRKAVHEILPLFIESDPGAKDCLKANRNIFRAAFTVEGYQEFEQSVKAGEFTAAVEILRKVARKHGISA